MAGKNQMSLRDLRRHAGRFVIAGFPGHSAPDDLRRLVAEFDLAGVIYFARNIVEPAQVAELSREVAALAREWPLWISVDQEGGRVARLRSPFTIWPPAATLGRGGGESLAVRYASVLATELRAVGINLDWAPVLDVHSNPANPVIGDRAFSSDPQAAALLGAAVVRALQQAGIAACGKHFPGHGDTSVDSHEALPVVEHNLRRLEAVEFVPFRAAIAADVATIMTAHVLVPEIDRDRLASFSPRVVTDVLKTSLDYHGVVVSDDLGMKAVSANTSLPEATVAAVQAGCDVVLLCNSTQDEQCGAIEALIRAVETGEVSQKRIDDAWQRQRAVKERFAAMAGVAPAIDRIGCEEHRAVAAEMALWQ
jgi:beta-N-acetylhexosaminidase